MYVEYNINPKKKKTGDCVIRAISVASGLDWDTVYIGLARQGLILKTCMSDIETVNSYLKSLGFIEGKIKINKGENRITVDEFAKEHPNWYSVLRVAGHLTCCSNGNYVDTWDCGDKSVYKYWYKPKN